MIIVSPALAEANNGNWQTASRWARMLRAAHPVRIVQQWPDEQSSADAVMLALHARRSAPAVQAWASRHPGHGLAVVLTGTDLYVDIAVDGPARISLAIAQRLVVLQELGIHALPQEQRGKARVIFQSVSARRELPKSTSSLTAVMVGHLREVKSPQTLFEAARLLRAHPQVRIRHIGDAQEPQWAQLAREVEATCPSYRWLGALPHGRTRTAIQRAHVLVHTSAAEGGAHVIMEAVRSGTPVLASRIPGNVGMLGEDYAGYFEHGDAPALASLLLQANDPAHELLHRLRAQCSLRAPLFEPLAEQRALLQLVQELQS